MSQTCTHIFVYGTLRPGHEPHERFGLSRLEHRGTHVAPGRMYDLGAYPGVAFAACADQVTGDLYAFPAEEGPALLAALDEYEGAPGLYVRVMIDVGGVQAWSYHYNGDEAALSARRLPAGDWSRRDARDDP